MERSLITEDIMILSVDEESYFMTRDNLAKTYNAIAENGLTSLYSDMALAVGSRSVVHLHQDNFGFYFSEIAGLCKIVVLWYVNHV